MIRGVRCLSLCLPLLAASCTLGWHHDGGPRTLSPAYEPGAAEDGSESGTADRSRTLALEFPADWSWYERGSSLVTTRDGVFLEHVLVERIHVDQREEDIAGWFPLSALSAKQWPTRTVRHLGRRFRRDMAPLEAAEVLLESRRNEALVSEFVLREVAAHPVAGRPGFRAVFDFRLRQARPDDLELGVYSWPPFSMQGRATPYRTTYYGFVLGEWFYGIECTAARRHYAEADAATFDAIVRSLRFVDDGP